MNRIAPLALAVSLASFSSVAAESLDVTAIQTQIESKQKEYDSFNDNLETEIATARSMEQKLKSLRQRGKELEAERVAALADMNAQFQRVVEDPSLDITAVQTAYQTVVKQHQQNKEDITVAYNDWQTQLQAAENLRVSKHSLLNKLETLKEKLHKARVERLYNEFNRQGNLTVNHSIECDSEETIAKCMDRGKYLAKQKASKRYLDELFDGLTESATAKGNRSSSEGFVQILRNETLANNFSGIGTYNVNMSVELKGSLSKLQACEVLGVDKRYCVGPELINQEPALAEEIAEVATDESVMYELEVRSNVFDDEVFIDGVSYGSTKLNVMLPSGNHDIKIVKRGYETHSETLTLRQNQSLRVTLDKAQYSFDRGEKIQDILRNDAPGPELVVIPSGGFRMGDLTGLGLDNERPVESYDINTSFGIGETEITVANFRRFVEASNYVTEAEKAKGCAYYDSGEPVWQENLNWRAPGFNQNDQHPVVCVSVNDAQAYVEWLSKETGQKYRLPTEVDWEYAARAGQESDYWWGENIDTNKANCGWCGSDWSNKNTAPVAQFSRNQFGLYDTVGNVWEWTVSSSSDSGAVVRGGAWNFAPRLARVSTRMELDSMFRSNYIGFRVVREQ